MLNPDSVNPNSELYQMIHLVKKTKKGLFIVQTFTLAETLLSNNTLI